MIAKKRLFEHQCENCKRIFRDHGPRTKYCPKQECQIISIEHHKQMKRNHNRMRMDDHKKSWLKGGQLCTEGCGRRTQNHFGKCDECRRVILQSLNYDMGAMYLC